MLPGSLPASATGPQQLAWHPGRSHSKPGHSQGLRQQSQRLARRHRTPPICLRRLQVHCPSTPLVCLRSASAQRTACPVRGRRAQPQPRACCLLACWPVLGRQLLLSMHLWLDCSKPHSDCRLQNCSAALLWQSTPHSWDTSLPGLQGPRQGGLLVAMGKQLVCQEQCLMVCNHSAGHRSRSCRAWGTSILPGGWGLPLRSLLSSQKRCLPARQVHLPAPHQLHGRLEVWQSTGSPMTLCIQHGMLAPGPSSVCRTGTISVIDLPYPLSDTLLGSQGRWQPLPCKPRPQKNICCPCLQTTQRRRCTTC